MYREKEKKVTEPLNSHKCDIHLGSIIELIIDAIKCCVTITHSAIIVVTLQINSYKQKAVVPEVNNLFNIKMEVCARVWGR